MAFNNGHALVIGVGEYDEKGLRTPKTGLNGEAITVSDAMGVAEALKNPKVAAYPPEQVTFLPDDQTTKQGITNALEALAKRTDGDSTVVIFFCGHGSPGDDKEYYFGTRDVKLAGKVFKGGTGLGKSELLTLLREIKAQKLLLIINACFSGSIGATLGPGDEEEGETLGTPPPQDLRMEVLATGEGRAIITASRSNQFSCFDRTMPNTYFGKALIDTLHGKDLAGGEFIGLYELYDTVFRKVKKAAASDSRVQEPVLTIVDQVGPFPVALAGGGTLGTLGGGDEISQAPEEDAAVERVSQQEVAKMAKKQSGGINISGGSISVGGDMVAGDKNVHGDEVHGNKTVVQGDQVQGDKVSGDKISVGNISGGQGFAIGSGATSTFTHTETHGVGAQELTALITAMNQQIAANKNLSSGDKEEVTELVGKIDKEAQKGDSADTGKLERWVNFIQDIAPDVLEVAAATLLNPVAGVSVALKHIIAKAQGAKGTA